MCAEYLPRLARRPLSRVAVGLLFLTLLTMSAGCDRTPSPGAPEAAPAPITVPALDPTEGGLAPSPVAPSPIPESPPAPGPTTLPTADAASSVTTEPKPQLVAVDIEPSEMTLMPGQSHQFVAYRADVRLDVLHRSPDGRGRRPRAGGGKRFAWTNPYGDDLNHLGRARFTRCPDHRLEGVLQAVSNSNR